jgi:hypothetical protein
VDQSSFPSQQARERGRALYSSTGARTMGSNGADAGTSPSGCLGSGSEDILESDWLFLDGRVGET